MGRGMVQVQGEGVGGCLGVAWGGWSMMMILRCGKGFGIHMFVGEGKNKEVTGF